MLHLSAEHGFELISDIQSPIKLIAMHTNMLVSQFSKQAETW